MIQTFQTVSDDEMVSIGASQGRLGSVLSTLEAPHKFH